MAAPTSPTVNPLPARRPLADTPHRPTTRPRSAAGGAGPPCSGVPAPDYQWPRRMTSAMGRRFGLAMGLSGRSAG
jgi:hypothetical protein